VYSRDSCSLAGMRHNELSGLVRGYPIQISAGILAIVALISRGFFSFSSHVPWWYFGYATTTSIQILSNYTLFLIHSIYIIFSLPTESVIKQLTNNICDI
jgi:hypothetical protein